MKHAFKVGFSFGVTSGIITTLGLMIGLYSGTASRMVVLGGIFTIAFADAMSDALGIHIAEESENVHTHKQVWMATGCTFLFKCVFALTFAIPLLIFSLPTAIVVNIIWALSIMTILSYFMAKEQGVKPLGVIGEHLLIAVTVVIITNFIGKWVASTFNL